MRRRPLGCLALLALPLALAGCGNSATPAQDVSHPLSPRAAIFQFFPRAGLRFYAPSNWSLRPGAGGAVETMSSGPGLIAIWRYPRPQPLPRTLTALRRARHALVGAARRRDPTLEVSDGLIGTVDRRPAIELVGRQHLAGQLRAMRSAHVYTEGSEYVVDELAPPADFERLDRSLFEPLLASMRFSRPRP